MPRALILSLNEEKKHSQQVLQSLRDYGHDVILSSDFIHAIRILKDKQVDLIISDVHLENGGNVFDFLRWVKKNPATKDTPFVLFSAEPTQAARYFEDGVRTSARILGASAYISMEIFDAEEFCSQIQALLPIDDSAATLTTNTSGEQ